MQRNRHRRLPQPRQVQPLRRQPRKKRRQLPPSAKLKPPHQHVQRLRVLHRRRRRRKRRRTPNALPALRPVRRFQSASRTSAPPACGKRRQIRAALRANRPRRRRPRANRTPRRNQPAPIHPVIAPSLAPETNFAYFAKTPVNSRFGAAHSARRRANSSSETSKVSANFSASIVIASPS